MMRTFKNLFKKVKDPIVCEEIDNVKTETINTITKFIMSQKRELEELVNIEKDLKDDMEKLCSVCSMHIVEEHKSCSERNNVIDQEVLTFHSGKGNVAMNRPKKSCNRLNRGVNGSPDRTPNPFQGKVKSMR
jgi:hypothetical protein